MPISQPEQSKDTEPQYQLGLPQYSNRNVKQLAEAVRTVVFSHSMKWRGRDSRASQFSGVVIRIQSPYASASTSRHHFRARQYQRRKFKMVSSLGQRNLSSKSCSVIGQNCFTCLFPNHWQGRAVVILKGQTSQNPFLRIWMGPACFKAQVYLSKREERGWMSERQLTASAKLPLSNLAT